METIIRPKKSLWDFDWKEIWSFRDLFYVLSWRDVKVRYKQTIMGAAWAIFQPLISMVVFTIFFGKLAKMPSDNIPYPLFVFTGLLFWQFFSSSLSSISNSFVGSAGMITKVYFPRIILPASGVITHFIDFLMATLVMVGLMIYYGYQPTLYSIPLTLLLVVMTAVSAMGIGLFFASLNVKYRDIRHVLPFFIQLLIFVTPVIYPVSIIAEKYRWILGINPMAGVISMARPGILGTGSIDWMLVATSSAFAFLYLIIGYLYFRKTERYFADVI